jgi:very-short-patch-repair endonuclease
VIDGAIAELAHPQQGQVARWQLLELGLSYAAIRWRAGHGRLFESFPGVYSLGHRPSSPQAWASAAVLAGGPGAVLSHESAAALWKMLPDLSRPFHVTARSFRRIDGIEVHRSLTLDVQDLTRQLGIPTTTAERTALDLAAAGANVNVLCRAVNQGRLAGFLHEAALHELLDRSTGQRGVRALRKAVGRQATGRAPTRSQLEDRFLGFARHHRLPTPLVNVKVAGHLVDAYFPRHKLVVELDGFEFHGDRASFETDRNRDADLLASGTATVRVTWERLRHAPDREADRLRRIMRSRA